MILPIALAERGLLPDSLVRVGVRRLLRQRLREETPSTEAGVEEKIEAFVRFLSDSPIAIETRAANEQHYEVPAPFFELLLGPRLKYSSCLWDGGVESLDDAEVRMLELTARRAGVERARRVLDLGCGWGSFSLWAAERFPETRFTAVSNSSTQREFILRTARERSLENIEVVTRDMNEFDAEDRFDRIVSIEMFEHLRNYRAFLAKARNWIEPEGRLFVHIFCHRRIPYAFEPVSDGDWMARHFFTGGIMPCFDLLDRFAEDFVVEESWRVSGLHYSKTLEAWLANLDREKGKALGIFSECYGPGEPGGWLQRWRIFLMACSELFAFRGGEEWLVGHYLLAPR